MSIIFLISSTKQRSIVVHHFAGWYIHLMSGARELCIIRPHCHRIIQQWGLKIYITALASAKVAQSHPPQNFSRKSGPACQQRRYNYFTVLAHFGTFRPILTPEPDDLEG
eukprot:sb/3477289/